MLCLNSFLILVRRLAHRGKMLVIGIHLVTCPQDSVSGSFSVYFLEFCPSIPPHPQRGQARSSPPILRNQSVRMARPEPYSSMVSSQCPATTKFSSSNRLPTIDRTYSASASGFMASSASSLRIHLPAAKAKAAFDEAP